MLGTVKKAGDVIGLFTRDQPELGVTEVAGALGIPKSTAHALMNSLVQIGLLRRTSGNRYRLGWRLLDLGFLLVETTEFRREAVPVMQRLADRYGETVLLAVLDGLQVICIEKIEGSRGARRAPWSAGARAPAHLSAARKVLLAGRPWEEVEHLLTQPGPHGLPDWVMVDRERLKAELEQIRESGFAWEQEASAPEYWSVAAPVVEGAGQTVAAISLSVPGCRFHQGRDQFQREILRAAREVSESIGYDGSP